MSAVAIERGRRMLNKVPEVTFYFWVIKVLCTTVGETASDYLSDISVGAYGRTPATSQPGNAPPVPRCRARDDPGRRLTQGGLDRLR